MTPIIATIASDDNRAGLNMPAAAARTLQASIIAVSASVAAARFSESTPLSLLRASAIIQTAPAIATIERTPLILLLEPNLERSMITPVIAASKAAITRTLATSELSTASEFIADTSILMAKATASRESAEVIVAPLSLPLPSCVRMAITPVIATSKAPITSTLAARDLSILIAFNAPTSIRTASATASNANADFNVAPLSLPLPSCVRIAITPVIAATSTATTASFLPRLLSTLSELIALTRSPTASATASIDNAPFIVAPLSDPLFMLEIRKRTPVIRAVNAITTAVAIISCFGSSLAST